MIPDRADRIRGGVVGVLVGDAFGVPYEFSAADRLPPLEQLAMTPPPGWPRAHDVPDGTWSDDGAQTLALLDSLLDHGTLDPQDFAQRLLQWRDEGRYAVDSRVFDIGIATARALEHVAAGVPTTECGLDGDRDNGNGSLMRALPLALLSSGDDARLITDAVAQSSVTHRHPRTLACVAYYCLWATELLEGQDSVLAWDAALARFEAAAPSQLRREFSSSVLSELDAPVQGTGYVVHSLLAARWLLATFDDYADVLRHAVALGDDTDTTAAIAGGLAGARAGLGGIPAQWRGSLRGRDILDPILAKLP